MVAVVVFAAAQSDAQQAGRGQLTVSSILPLIVSYPADGLAGVAFSLRNGTNRPLVWATFRVIVRNHAKDVIDERTERIQSSGPTETFGVDPDGTARIKVAPARPILAPGGVTQFQIALGSGIRGFRTPSGTGSVEITVVDFALE